VRGRFADCSIDTAAREVTRGGTRLELPPKAFLLLEALLEAHPAAVSKEVLYERLWPGVFVEMGNLHTLVSEIRSAIGDDRHEIIRTVHRFGYALATDFASDEKPAAILIVGNRSLPLPRGATIIGRDLIGSVDVSRNHARITVTDDSISIADLGSKNGTWLRGQRIDSAPLTDGDELFLGNTRVVVRRAFDESTMTSPHPVNGSCE
jgi:DNA-binding winged helix-turn-helix (wHTH) protein